MRTKSNNNLLCVLAALCVLASCAGDSQPDGAALPEAAAILQFRSDSEDLRLASLQVGANVHADAHLRLARDGRWQLISIGGARVLGPGESAQAVLTAPAGTVPTAAWRPQRATITIRRMHIGAKVFGNVALQLDGDRWFWGPAFQAGNDSADLHELTALTLADYRANPALAATDRHHTVLQSEPGTPVQSFPVRLAAKTYRFCMDRQDAGADTVRLLDAAGHAVLSVKAGEPCARVVLRAGLYTLQHEYGGAGASRAVFVRPPAVVQAAAPRAVPGAQDGDHPEYWAVYVPQKWGLYAAGFLSFNGTVDYLQGLQDQHACLGNLDAAAQLTPFTRPSDPSTYSLFDGRSFFLIARDAAGTPTDLSYPLYCSRAVESRFRLWISEVSTQTMLLFYPYLAGVTDPFGTQAGINSTLYIDSFAADTRQFRLLWDRPQPWGETFLSFYGGLSRVAKPILTLDDQNNLVYAANRINSRFGRPDNDYLNGALAYESIEQYADSFQVGFRYFPNGVASPESWQPEPGEAALFSGPGCTGALMVARDFGIPSLGFPTMPASLKLGTGAAVTFYAQTNFQGASSLTYEAEQVPHCWSLGALQAASMQIGDVATIAITTGSCEGCNLAGIDLSGQAVSLKGSKLQRANLAGAVLAGSDLTLADLRYANLQGANLGNMNLERANLCQASLNAGTSGGTAAQLAGAHLKNANLSGANVDGANFTNASFYSSSQQACQPASCDTYAVPACASAYQARMNNARFGNAYLANLDMSHAVASSADFSNAVLFGASLTGADLNADSREGTGASFASAFLQGADFTGANLRYVSFSGAYVDPDLTNDCMQVRLRNESTAFPGFTGPSATRPVRCVARGDPAAQSPISSCVSATYAANAARPLTDDSNTCPDAVKYATGCSEQAWRSPTLDPAFASLPNKTCRASLCNPFTENTCWN